MSEAPNRLFPTITEEALDALRRRLNVRIENTLEPWCHEASRDAIRHYAHGIGDDNPPPLQNFRRGDCACHGHHGGPPRMGTESQRGPHDLLC